MKTIFKILILTLCGLYEPNVSFCQRLTAPPRNLSATPSSSTSINLSWENPEDTGPYTFTIFRALPDGSSFGGPGTYQQIGQTSSTQFTNTGLTPSSTYFYKVYAKSGSNSTSRASNEVSATTLPPLPSPPINLDAFFISGRGVTVTWTPNNGNEVTFILERSDNNGSFQEIATVPSDRTVSYTDPNTLPAHQYCYRVKARNSSGDSGYSNTGCVTRGDVAPASPDGLIATSLNPTFQIQLNWLDKSSNETGFEIERSTDNTNFSKIATVGANITQFNNINLAASTRFYYRIRAINSSGSSGYSNVADATTNANPPSTPTGLTASAPTSDRIDLSWSDASGNEDGFEIERSQDGISFIKITDVPANTTTYPNSGLSAKTQYWYRVRAKNNGGTSSFSNVANAITKDNVPNAPQNLSAHPVSNTRIDLSWQDNSGNETSFELERSTDGSNFSKIAEIGANATTFQNTGLTTLTKYWYRIKAKNEIGYSAYSNVVEVSTLDVPPNAPTSLTAKTISSSQIDLAWVDNSGNESGFDIERSTDGAIFTKVGETGSNATTFQSTGLSPATKYWYRIQSKNSQGSSDYTNVASATTIDVVPDIPQNLIATPVSNKQITLSWNDNAKNEQGYEVEISTNGTSFNKIADLPANTQQYESVGLTTLTSYWFRIRGKNAIGYSAYSNIAQTTTYDVPPIAPTTLSAKTISSSQIDLTWKDNATNETSFVIERSTDGTKFSKIGEVGANQSTYSATNLSPATKYWFRVQSRNSQGGSDYSNSVQAITKDVIPANPISLIATAISWQQIKLTWEDKSGNEVSFEIERSADGVSFSKIGNTSANVILYQDNGLKELTKYYYRARATNDIGPSGYTDVANATTPKAPIPAKPQHLTATPVDYDLVTLKWDQVSSNSTEVIIERSQQANEGFKEIGRVPANITTFPDHEILEVRDYYYRIKAINGAGGSPYSDLAKLSASDVITGVEPINTLLPVIYSNNQRLYIQLNVIGKVTIYNTSGTALLHFSASGDSQTDLTRFAPGIYIVTIETAKSVFKKKILIH